MSRFGFVQDHSSALGVKRLCQVLGLTRSSYYAWKKAGKARVERAEHDAELTESIRAIHNQDPAYGEPRITAEPRERGYEVNHKRVERLARGRDRGTASTQEGAHHRARPRRPAGAGTAGARLHRHHTQQPLRR